MKCFIWQFILLISVASGLEAQTPLQFFTNEANALLQADFGIGVTNIPVYSSTNPAIGYSASLHYLLQSAANDYDATTPATNLPSVFRPLFSRQTNTLLIVGYSCVTTDFYAQIARGFKALTDPTITSNDNVWGIPWVIGAKGQVPAFNEYCYASEIFVSRELLFGRALGGGGLPATNLPPRYTNEFYMMSISNAFGAEAWNFYPGAFNNSVTLIASNQVSITITNNYNFGTNYVFSATTNWPVDFWPGWSAYNRTAGFLIPLFTNTIALPLSYWSESTGQLVAFLPDTPVFLESDLQQTGWPVHDWTMNITNSFIYAMVDNSTGQVVDFANLGAFGSSLDFNQVLSNNFSEFPNPWVAAPATDYPNSPMSIGVRNQIDSGIEASPLFYNSIEGRSPNIPGQYFSDPYTPYACFIQSCSWQTGNPLVHYTVEDLTNSGFNEQIVSVPLSCINDSLAKSMSTLGEVNPGYNSGAVEDVSFNLSDGLFQIGFTGTADLPYAVWASTNLTEWSQIGTAAQPLPCLFQFSDEATTNYSARFYQLRLP